MRHGGAVPRVADAMSDLWIVHATRYPLRGFSRWCSRTWRNVARWLRWGTRRQTSEYRAFMASPDWRAQRARVLRRDGDRCRACGRPGREAHHTYYAVPIVATPDEAIQSLCESCHRLAHRDRHRAPTSRRRW